MRTCTIVVNDARTATITVNSVSSNIDILGYHQEPLEILFSWTSAPTGTAMTGARFEARYDKDDAAGSGPIDVTGTITNAGTDGTVAATIDIDLSLLLTSRTYADVITLSDDNGNTKTWVGNVRALP